MSSPQLLFNLEEELCPYCDNKEQLEGSEEGYFCPKCLNIFHVCDKCYPGVLEGNVMISCLVKWGINSANKDPPFVPEIATEMGGFPYVDDSSVFLYNCLRCKRKFLKNCD